jgi:hypothetical protein
MNKTFISESNLAKELLNKLPLHVQELLKLHGTQHLPDFIRLDDESIKSIEDSVRNGNLLAIVDLSDPANRVKYLGAADANFQMFTFNPNDRLKLLQLKESIMTVNETRINMKRKLEANR